MAFSDKAVAKLLAKSQYRNGINAAQLRAFLDAGKLANATANVPDVQDVDKVDVDDSAQTVQSGSGRVYGLLIASPDGANDDVVVHVFDNTVLIGAGSCVAEKGGQVFFFSENEKPGTAFTTSLKVKAFKKSDGSTAPDTADKPVVTVLFGVS